MRSQRARRPCWAGRAEAMSQDEPSHSSRATAWSDMPPCSAGRRPPPSVLLNKVLPAPPWARAPHAASVRRAAQQWSLLHYMGREEGKTLCGQRGLGWEDGGGIQRSVGNSEDPGSSSKGSTACEPLHPLAASQHVAPANLQHHPELLPGSTAALGLACPPVTRMCRTFSSSSSRARAWQTGQTGRGRLSR